MDICKISRRKLILSTFGHWISSNIGRFERFSTLLRPFLTPNNIVWLLRMTFSFHFSHSHKFEYCRAFSIVCQFFRTSFLLYFVYSQRFPLLFYYYIQCKRFPFYFYSKFRSSSYPILVKFSNCLPRENLCVLIVEFTWNLLAIPCTE